MPGSKSPNESRRQLVTWRILFGVAITGIVTVSGILWFMFTRGGMTKVTAWYLFQFALPLLGLISLVLVVMSVFITHTFTKTALFITALSLAAILPALLMVIPVTYPASIKAMNPSVTVRLPSDAPLKVAWGGDNVRVNYHASFPDQRWAYDFVVKPYFCGSTNLSDYGAYGTPIVAPASGRIAVVHEGEPDMKSGALSNNAKVPFGNYIAIKLPTETYLIIAHLKAGSILVKEGEQVNEGQRIAECGNSGNTSEPHIHIHHQRQNPKEYPINFAEGLPLFFRGHDGPRMPTGGIRIENGVPIAIGPTVRQVEK